MTAVMMVVLVMVVDDGVVVRWGGWGATMVIVL